MAAIALLWSAGLRAEGTQHRMIVLSGSIKPVVAVASANPSSTNPHPMLVRSALTDEENAATMKFEVALKMRNFDELRTRIGRGEIIPAPEMAEKYFPLASDYEATAAWIESLGLTITASYDNHLSFFVQGTVSQIREALQVNFARVAYRGGEYTSAISAPSIPEELVPALVGINGLQPHLRLRPHHVRIKPNTISSNFSPYVPGNIATAYNAGGLSVNGAGQTIAIVGYAYPLSTDLSQFWRDCSIGQSISSITEIPVNSGPSPGVSQDDQEEITLDVEWSSSMAPAAAIRVYGLPESDGFGTEAFQQIISDLPSHPQMHQVSMSYGENENELSASQLQSGSQYFATLAGQGVTVFFSSGDGGSRPNPDTGGFDDAGPPEVDYPASDPSIVGVGGTSLVYSSTPPDAGYTETVWFSDGGGSGGGASTQFSRPSWQIGQGVPAGTQRLVPDVALSADPNYPAFMIFDGLEIDLGGTSFSSPIWAGFCAIFNQARIQAGLGPVGLLNSKIYPLVGSSSFQDIVSGYNGDFDAHPGYDECTGLGTPNVAVLVQALALASPASLAPTISAPIQNRTVNANQNVAFSVAATSFTPLTYQWQLLAAGSGTWVNLADVGPYSGTASPTLSINPADISLSGDQFRCIVGNASGDSIASNAATLTVDDFLTILAQPANEQATIGQSAFFFISSSGVPAPTFQWQRLPFGSAVWTNLSDGEIYSGSLSSTLGIFSVTLSMAGDQFRCIATNSTGSVTTSAATLLLNYSINDSGTPESQTVAVGQSAVFTGFPNGNPLPSVQWERLPVGSSQWTTLVDGGDYSGTKTAALTVSGTTVAMSGDQFRYVATNFLGSTTSGPAALKVVASYIVTTLAGIPGLPGSADGPDSASQFNDPCSVTIDASGNFYVADASNDTIREITPDGAVTTVAGTAGDAGSADGIGAAAQFDYPVGVTVDANYNLYVADFGSSTIRKITLTGLVSTLAGTPGNHTIEDGTGSGASFFRLAGIAVDANDNLYVADTDVVEKITPDGVVTALAGGGLSRGSADGSGSAAEFGQLSGIAIDENGNLYVTDGLYSTVRKITAAGAVTTLAGTPESRGSADGIGPAAQFSNLGGVAVDGNGNVYVLDNGMIREITPTGTVTTLAGTAGRVGYGNGIGSGAQFSYPAGLAVDGVGAIYVADSENDVIRKAVMLTGSSGPAITTQPQGQIFKSGSTVVITAAAPGASSYQWYFNGVAIVDTSAGTAADVISGATGPQLTIAAASAASAGSYTLVAVSSAGSTISSPASIQMAPPGPALVLQPESQTLNLGSTVVFMGAAPEASGYQWYLNGVALADTAVGTANDAISGSTGPQLVITRATTASNGSYTLVATNSSGGSTTSNPAALQVMTISNPGLASSISTRAFVGTGDNLLIGGFYVVGSTSRTVLVQALGPALGQFGVTGFLAHPELSIHQTQNGHDITLYSNTGWGSSQVLLNAAASVFASPTLAPGSADSELLMTLPPGGYSAEVAGADVGTGVALCAIYELP